MKRQQEKRPNNLFKLYNRYRDRVYLEETDDDDLYKLIVDNDSEYDLFTQYSYEKWPDDIYSVDPSGGPYICIGNNELSVINNENICKIKFYAEKIFVNISGERITDTYIKIKDLQIIKHENREI